MDRNALTLLGCSSSFAFMLLTVNATDADTVVPQNLGANTRVTTAQTVKAPIYQEPPSFSTASPKSIEGLAIAKFGCDCPGCRARVAQMVQQGAF
jgi:hypothetical protein